MPPCDMSLEQASEQMFRPFYKGFCIVVPFERMNGGRGWR
jgi:hypothetical protein